MVCPNCGANQVAGAKFCNQCGTRLPEAVVTTINPTCAQCGHVNPEDSKFCGECGASLEVVTVPAPSPASAPVSTGFISPPAAAEPPLASARVSMRLISPNGTVIYFPPSPTNSWLVGREDPVNNIQPDIDLTPYDPERTVSRRHARILLTGGTQPMIISTTLTNWTKINGTRIETNQPVLLCPGDRIELGRCVVTFEM